jgi:hypothetical protein
MHKGDNVWIVVGLRSREDWYKVVVGETEAKY